MMTRAREGSERNEHEAGSRIRGCDGGRSGEVLEEHVLELARSDGLGEVVAHAGVNALGGASAVLWYHGTALRSI